MSGGFSIPIFLPVALVSLIFGAGLLAGYFIGGRSISRRREGFEVTPLGERTDSEVPK